MLTPERSINLLNSGDYIKMARREEICEMIQGLLQQLVKANDENARLTREISELRRGEGVQNNV